MRSWTEKDVENLLRNSVFPNPQHKEQLKKRLLDEGAELSLEDLSDVAAGMRPRTDKKKTMIFPEDQK